MNKEFGFILILFNLLLVVASRCENGGNIMDCIFKVNEINENEDAYSSKISVELFEGDIVWTKKLKAQIGEMRARAGDEIDTFDAIRNGAWPRGIVPYVFANGFKYKSIVTQAIAEYNQKTCIRFVPYTKANGASGYVEFMHGGGCYSMIGRQGGKQQISLGNGCGHKGVAIHEMMHALGWFHEQSRRDRDSYIKINWNNINRRMWYNFEKYKDGQASTLGERYDKNSVMHYGNYAFSINRQKTIESVSNPSETLGQRSGLSAIDVRQLNKYYKCDGTTVVVTKAPPTNNCKNGYTFCSSLSNWCNHSWVKTNCKSSCKLCPPKEVCKDNHTNCGVWSKSYCHSGGYKNYMEKHCRRACGFCR